MINYGIVILLFVIVQVLSSTGNLSRLLTGLLVPICVYTIAAVSLNLVVGFSGELSLGHAGFMCVGAFSSALFSHAMSDIPQIPRFILAILVGAAVAAVFGLIIGIPVLRLRGDYLAIVTLAFGEIIKNLINVLYIGVDDHGLHVATSSAGLHLEAGGKQILKGALGISGTGALYKDIKSSFFIIGVILLLITLFIVQNLVHSRSGRAIMSTRDNRIAAESVGINITKYKLLAFTISAALSTSSVYNRKYYDSEIFYNQNSGVHYYEKNPTDRHRRYNRFQIYQRRTFPSDFRRRTVGIYPHCQRVLHHRHPAAFFSGQYQCMC